MDEEFEEFFVQCDLMTNSNKKQLVEILRPLRSYLFNEVIWKFVKFSIIFATICCSIYYIDTLNWFFCALSRFIIIKVLPIWNWRYLGNARCLIAKAENPPQRFKSNNFNAKNCRACEHFNVIDAVENTKYNLLYNKYLLRGLPVIITDSVESNESSESLAKFLGHLYSNMSSIVEHKACDLETNLMITQRADIEKAFRILREYNDLTSWFLSFRTCRFQALKASRLIMKKPYFYPKNLQAPSTAWVLLSDNYESDESSLTFFGLIIVSQLKGTLKIHLKPKDVCENICENLNLSLYEGESLILLSDLWKFFYKFSNGGNFTLTYVTETDFN